MDFFFHFFFVCLLAIFLYIWVCVVPILPSCEVSAAIFFFSCICVRVPAWRNMIEKYIGVYLFSLCVCFFFFGCVCVLLLFCSF
ncbi:hypothetical protein TCDM_04229 [Trypanosoma cruzi Dm28c]|uniref:Uncharacterized protein n=1 Tax=Trypanosoma cruzi Dm28c TaxID=1416333 RepID=V5BLW7_TRYCR|nr:hypothetical protein TCDM_04229 [Trypanosoma cruzi Dm28c]